MTMPVLWHFRFSHFNEKARWALDWKGLAHRRRALLLGLHRMPLRWMTGQTRVPVLVLHGRPISDSSAIIAALEAHRPTPALYPSDATEKARALALEDFFDEELGPHVRRVIFHALLDDPEYTVTVLTTGFSMPTRWLYRCLFPLLRQVGRREMQIRAETVALSRAKMTAAMDRLEAEIGPQGYLVGDRFSVADLTAAALLGALVVPQTFGLPPLAPCVEVLHQWLRERPAFDWVHEMYRRHRGTSAEVARRSSAAAAGWAAHHPGAT